MKVRPGYPTLEGVHASADQREGAGEKCSCGHVTPHLRPFPPVSEIEDKDSACMGEAVTLFIKVKEGPSLKGSGQPEQPFSYAARDRGGRRKPEAPGQLQAVEAK